MLQAAAIARRAWAVAGTWLHVERAEYQLAQCHAVLGQGAVAVEHARQCLSMCAAGGGDAVELFFAHEAMTLALRAAGDEHSARQHREQMQAELELVDDDDTRAWCASVLAALAP